jgi:hypothetical protein
MDPKQWLEIAIKSVLLTENSPMKQHALIMEMIEAYEAMKTI